MNNQIHYIDELLDAFRTSREAPVGTHLTDDECIRYTMGALNSADEDAIDAHLAVCPTCTAHIEHLFTESQPWSTSTGQERLDAFGKTLLDQLAANTKTTTCNLSADAGALEEAFQKHSSLRLRTQNELTVLELLADLDVIERDYDYVLPSGYHCDTYVNTGKLCRSEEGLREIARLFDSLFDDVVFDTVVCSGWATGMIARRLARERSARSDTHIRVVVTEGYSTPSFTEDILPNAKVLVLIDVSITGQLSARLRNRIHQYGAAVIAAGCIVRPSSPSAADYDNVRSLAVIDMMLNDPAHDQCPRCATLRKLVFNPISSQMTVKKLVPRSPTQFLQEFPEAVTFWEAVNTAQVYEHHRIEGNTHYLAFVNTAQMIAHPTVGPSLVRSLIDLLVKDAPLPRVILVPDRSRARLLASKLVESLAGQLKSQSVDVVLAQRRHAFWRITDNVRQRIAGKNVLVLDSASGHGCVLDELTILAREAGGLTVSAAVLLSRLTLSCEEAFQHRLGGRFVRLFHLPIRPVAIRTDDRSLCPVCHQRTLVQQAAEERQDKALVQLAKQALSKRRRPVFNNNESPIEEMRSQLLLFDVPKPSLLQRCKRGVASGITLHALHTAMTDGMAPLTLPELRNTQIPSENRVAMLEHLPPGVFAWSDNHLDQSVEDVLAEGSEEKVWLASADILAREGQTYWLAYLKSFLQRSFELQSKPHDSFWNRLAYGAYRLSSQDADVRDEINEIIRLLLDAYQNAAPANGLLRMVDVVTNKQDDVPTIGQELS